MQEKFTAKETNLSTKQTFKQWLANEQQLSKRRGYNMYPSKGGNIVASCTYKMYSKPQLIKLKDSHNKAKEYVEEAVKYLQDQTQAKQLYKKWFGKPDPKNFKRVNVFFRETKDGLTKPYVYNLLPEKLCGKSFLAHVDSTLRGKNQHVVNICPLFFKSTMKDRMVTLIHEMTHDSAETYDMKLNGEVCYGEKLCEELAKKEPDNATYNADNYALFADEVNTINEQMKNKRKPPRTVNRRKAKKNPRVRYRLVRLFSF